MFRDALYLSNRYNEGMDMAKKKNEGNGSSAEAATEKAPESSTALTLVRPAKPTEYKGSELMLLNHKNPAKILRDGVQQLGLNAFGLNRLKIPSGGITSFVVPGLEGDKLEKEVTGVVLFAKGNEKAWYRSKKVTGQRPDCASHDGMQGYGCIDPKIAEGEIGPQEDHLCGECPWNKWGTAVDAQGKPGKGKACKDMQIALILQPESLLPLTMTIPPTSLSAMRDYSRNLMTAGRQLTGVVTKLTLMKQDTSGHETAVLTMAFVADLTLEQHERVAALTEVCGEMVAAGYARAEYHTEN